MAIYIVTSDFEKQSLTKFFTKAGFIQAKKEAQKELRSIVEAFAAAHTGQVTVGKEDAWINNTLKIETTAALAAELRKVKGISDVSAPRQISFG